MDLFKLYKEAPGVIPGLLWTELENSCNAIPLTAHSVNIEIKKPLVVNQGLFEIQDNRSTT